MYRELIETCAKDFPYAFPEDPATQNMLRALADYLGHPLPRQLHDLLLEMDGDHYLLLSVIRIRQRLELNREFFSELPGIEDHIFFAGNGCGDYFCYNVLPDGTVDESAIYLWRHEDNSTAYAAGDIKELIIRFYGGELG